MNLEFMGAVFGPEFEVTTAKEKINHKEHRGRKEMRRGVNLGARYPSILIARRIRRQLL